MAMIDTIGESAVRMTTRNDSNLAVEHKDIAIERSKRPLKSDPSKVHRKVQKPNRMLKRKPVVTMRMRRESSLKNMMSKEMSFTERRRNKSP
jgi:hypothetical protein